MAAPRVSDERILDATATSIRTHGVNGATTREIARLAGINEITLFRRFGDKRQLVRAAVHAALDRLGAAEFAATDDLSADLSAIIRFYTAAFDPEHGFAVTLLTEASRHPDLGDLLAEPIGVLTRVGEVIGHHQRRGTLIAEPVGEALAALIGPLLISSLGRPLAPAVFTPPSIGDDRTASLVERFLRGHGAVPARRTRR